MLSNGSMLKFPCILSLIVQMYCSTSLTCSSLPIIIWGDSCFCQLPMDVLKFPIHQCSLDHKSSGLVWLYNIPHCSDQYWTLPVLQCLYSAKLEIPGYGNSHWKVVHKHHISTDCYMLVSLKEGCRNMA